MIVDIVIPFARRRATRSWHRSMAKTLSWRLFATLDSFVISLLVTHSWTWAGSIVGIEALTKTGWYFMHERAWTRIWAAPLAPHSPIVARAPQAPVVACAPAPPIAVAPSKDGRGPTAFHRCLAVHLHYAANSGAMRSR